MTNTSFTLRLPDKLKAEMALVSDIQGVSEADFTRGAIRDLLGGADKDTLALAAAAYFEKHEAALRLMAGVAVGAGNVDAGLRWNDLADRAATFSSEFVASGS